MIFLKPLIYCNNCDVIPYFARFETIYIFVIINNSFMSQIFTHKNIESGLNFNDSGLAISCEILERERERERERETQTMRNK